MPSTPNPTAKTVFLVEFKDKGYYAKKQPHYEWSFAHTPAEAAQYATESAAEKRGLQQGGQFRIVELLIKTETKVTDISEWTSKLLKHGEKKAAQGPAEKITLASLITK